MFKENLKERNKNRKKKKNRNKNDDSETESEDEDSLYTDNSTDNDIVEHPNMYDRWYCFVTQSKEIMCMSFMQ